MTAESHDEAIAEALADEALGVCEPEGVNPIATAHTRAVLVRRFVATLRQRANKFGARAAIPAAPAPEKSWRCFHCDEIFTTVDAAREHFGADEICEPACKIDVEEYRRLEAQQASCRAECCEEAKRYHAAEDDRRRALIAEEQKGYDRGLADGIASTPAAPAPEGEIEAALEMGMRCAQALLDEGYDGYWSEIEKIGAALAPIRSRPAAELPGRPIPGEGLAANLMRVEGAFQAINRDVDKSAIEKHRAYLKCAEEVYARLSNILAALRAAEAQREVVEALRPFADIDGEGDEDFPDDQIVVIKFGRTTHYPVRLGDFRRARAALSRLADAKSEKGA